MVLLGVVFNMRDTICKVEIFELFQIRLEAVR